jgi:hypothetical protein
MFNFIGTASLLNPFRPILDRSSGHLPPSLRFKHRDLRDDQGRKGILASTGSHTHFFFSSRVFDIISSYFPVAFLSKYSSEFLPVLSGL